MRTEIFGSTTTAVPVIGQGSWYIEKGERAAAVGALRRGLDLGLRHIDTAEMYGAGGAEEIVGEAIRGRRDEVFLVSKVLPSNASRRGTRTACEQTLKRLGTDHLDCYLLHWRGSYPLEETFATFEELLQEGKIRAFGVSNFDVADLDEALAVLGPGKLACNQVLYHLRERTIEHAVLPWCEREQLAVVAYSPFGHGDFPPDSSPQGRALAEVAQEYGATMRQVALAFLVRHPAVFAIPKAMRLDHVEDNAGAGELVLGPEAIARLDEVFPRGRRPASLPMI